MSKKVLKLTKPTSVVHSKDWNPRFWVDKIPEYNKLSSVPEDFKPKLYTRLPKIYSASLAKLISPGKNENESESPYKVQNLSAKSEKFMENKPSRSFILEKKTISKKNFKEERESIRDTKPNTVKYQKKIFPENKNAVQRPSIIQSEKVEQIKLTSKSVEPRKSRILLPLVSQKLLSTIRNEEVLKETDEVKEIFSESEESERDEIYQYSIKILIDTLSEGVHRVLTELSLEAVHEALLAYLQLSANKILFMYIIEVLDDFVPAIARSAYNESKEKEPSEFCEVISDEVFKEELWRVIETINVEKISIAIEYDYLHLLPLEYYVKESIKEIKKENKIYTSIVFENLIAEIVEEEWIEVLVEDVINSLRIEEIWTLFPPNVQKEVSDNQRSKIVENLAEKIYFDALNDVLADIWVFCICEACIKECQDEEIEEDIENLMPIPKFTVKKT